MMFQSTHDRIVSELRDQCRQAVRKAMDERDAARDSLHQWKGIAARRQGQSDYWHTQASYFAAKVPLRGAKGRWVKRP